MEHQEYEMVAGILDVWYDSYHTIHDERTAMSILEDIKAIVPQYHGDCHDIITTRFHDDPMQLDVLHALSRLAGQFDDTGKRPSIISEFADYINGTDGRSITCILDIPYIQYACMSKYTTVDDTDIMAAIPLAVDAILESMKHDVRRYIRVDNGSITRLLNSMVVWILKDDAKDSLTADALAPYVPVSQIDSDDHRAWKTVMDTIRTNDHQHVVHMLESMLSIFINVPLDSQYDVDDPDVIIDIMHAVEDDDHPDYREYCLYVGEILDQGLLTPYGMCSKSYGIKIMNKANGDMNGAVALIRLYDVLMRTVIPLVGLESWHALRNVHGRNMTVVSENIANMMVDADNHAGIVDGSGEFIMACIMMGVDDDRIDG